MRRGRHMTRFDQVILTVVSGGYRAFPALWLDSGLWLQDIKALEYAAGPAGIVLDALEWTPF